MNRIAIFSIAVVITNVVTAIVATTTITAIISVTAIVVVTSSRGWDRIS